jgi:hypothetical protein
MNKFLTLAFLGLLLVILSLSTRATRRDRLTHRSVPTSYATLPATALPHSSNALDSYLSSRLLVASQR